MANKTDYKTVIKIEGDTKSAEAGISRVKGAFSMLQTSLLKVRAAISKAMQAFGVFYLAAEGFRLVVNAIKSLREWLNRAAVAAKELQDRLANESAANAAAHAAEAYKKLNKELAEANRLERERNAILDARKTKERDLEDADSERSKQIEISKLDPASATYAEDKAAIERKYARQASETALARANQDTREGARRLYDEADRRDREANETQKIYERQLGASDRYRDLTWRYGMEARRGVEGAQEKHDAAEQQWRQSYDEAIKTKEAMEALRKEADSLRLRAGEMTGGSRAAAIRNEATQLGIDNQEREAAARKEQEAERAAEAARREAERQAEADRRTKEREIVEQIRTTDDVASGIVSVAPSQSRLNAMGLGAGSGVQRVQQEMVNSLKDLVRLGRDQLAALKDIQNEDAGATFQ